MAPEQCGTPDRRGTIGGATDVWGLGATLYHAVSGHVPFPRERGGGSSDDRNTRFPQLVDEPQPMPGDVPVALEELILATLRKDPTERPSAKDLALGLEPLVASMPRLVRLGRGGSRRRPSAPAGF
jgi:serine/threonine protein kinase